MFKTFTDKNFLILKNLITSSNFEKQHDLVAKLVEMNLIDCFQEFDRKQVQKNKEQILPRLNNKLCINHTQEIALTKFMAQKGLEIWNEIYPSLQLDDTEKQV